MGKGRFHLTFPPDLVQEPVVWNLGTRFDLVTNITRAAVEERGGWMILELEGPEDRLGDALSWLAGQGVHVDRIDGE